ncbi:MAG: transcription-repair coupling factor [Calditrichaeota bacterium]|nr:MAG: transcription-repair coupling factor [Calditrichota bacterium]
MVRLGARGQETLNGDLKLLKASLTRLDSELRNGSPRDPAIFFVCDTPHQRERLEEIFADEGLSRPNLRVEAIRLHKGFVFPEAGLVLFTDSQFYGRTKRLRLPKKAHRGLTPKQLRYLREGDYVVHVDFGIGIFRGLKKITVRGHERECLHLEYKDGDTVYVRVERMDRVHKYSSKDGAAPVLSKLGSPNWQRLKRRTKKRIQDIAKELIELYARRQAEGGITFEQDSLWQQELEASFPFEDTPDQIKATLDVKRDMESPKPMDRLVCGDVGFGKTEIAVRAAFKAVMSQKQVAMLVPTTILAYQHYNTFRQRLEKFPVRVEMLSRFRTTGEQRRILAQLAAGQIDIVIGTHRLLSKDVHFKDLGLLIIDEEQRFGVRHKEHLKRLRATVDVLTLTATPIPRTLQFALMGARDMTNINTPPKNRLPIVTEILTFNKAYIREVILRELERGGQVFFVHNRVRSIERVARMLADLVPEADVAVAHGQMHEKELERVMIDFMERRFQILVSTMIIESGLDMPNVNTIIINRADRLGLAQLYQLRGRVGRSHQRAYAYLLIPPVESLTEDALKRLRAIEEFSEIGSGSLLALRDLEIRGAGNLLGAEQTGFIDSLGFELYTKIVEEAVRELKTEASAEPVPPEIDTRVEVDFEAALPQTYIESGSERVDLYRRLTLAQDVGELDALREEIEDRFGRLPRAVVNLLDSLALRMLGKKLGLRTVRIEKQEMVAIFSPDALAPQGEPFKKWLGSIVEKANQPFEFTQGEGLGVRLRFESQDGDQLSVARAFLSSLADA